MIAPSGGGSSLVKGIPVDNADLANQKILKYNSATGHLEYETDAGAGGTIASQAEAEAGTLNDVYMTPLRTAQAITAQATGGTTSFARTLLLSGS
jgi:hypothetical protein